MKNEITLTITISGPVTDGIQSFLSRNGISAGDLGTMLQALVANFGTGQDSPPRSPRGRNKARASHSENEVPGELREYGKKIKATMESPLTLAAVCHFCGMSRSKLSADQRRGYEPLYGNRTTPAHYLEWLSKNPIITKRLCGFHKFRNKI